MFVNENCKLEFWRHVRPKILWSNPLCTRVNDTSAQRAVMTVLNDCGLCDSSCKMSQNRTQPFCSCGILLWGSDSCWIRHVSILGHLLMMSLLLPFERAMRFSWMKGVTHVSPMSKSHKSFTGALHFRVILWIASVLCCDNPKKWWNAATHLETVSAEAKSTECQFCRGDQWCVMLKQRRQKTQFQCCGNVSRNREKPTHPYYTHGKFSEKSWPIERNKWFNEFNLGASEVVRLSTSGLLA